MAYTKNVKKHKNINQTTCRQIITMIENKTQNVFYLINRVIMNKFQKK